VVENNGRIELKTTDDADMARVDEERIRGQTEGKQELSPLSLARAVVAIWPGNDFSTRPLFLPSLFLLFPFLPVSPPFFLLRFSSPLEYRGGNIAGSDSLHLHTVVIFFFPFSFLTLSFA
jgi:hypothetical protein